MPRAKLPGRERLLCHYCGVRPGTTIDHVVPRALGGPDARYNYQPSCETCNYSKGSSWPTCPCDFCESARVRFLSNPEKRQRVMDRILDNIMELDQAESALKSQARVLRGRRIDYGKLYGEIKFYPTEEAASD